MTEEERTQRTELLLGQKLLTKGRLYMKGKNYSAYLLGVVPGVGVYTFYFSLPTYSRDFYACPSTENDWRFENTE